MKKARKKEGPTRAQMQAHIERLQARLKMLEAKLAPRKGTIRREGEHWYALVDLLDPSQIERVRAPFREPTYFVGQIDSITILEYPPHEPASSVRSFLQTLRAQGIAPVLAVRQGVRFLKLATVDLTKERELDEEVKRAEDSDAAQRQAGDSGDRPELRGDGLDGGGPAGEAPDRGGSDPDREGAPA